MDSLSTQKAKPRKMKVVVKKSQFQILLNLFYRVVEITVVMVTLAKFCYQLVIMFEDSGLSCFLINRHLAFVLGNAIVIVVVATCGLFVNQEPDAPIHTNDFYNEFVLEISRREIKAVSREKKGEARNKAKPSTEEKIKKHIKTENSVKQSSGEESVKEDITVKRHKQIIIQKQESPKQSYERSCSETERPADADDELRYKIESFIARQRRNQKDEEFCII